MANNKQRLFEIMSSIDNSFKSKLNEELENYEWNKDNVAANKIVPPQYVYHMSDKKNRNGILQNGLEPSVGDSYKSWTQTEKTIPAIFATITETLNDLTGGIENFQSDIWEIDTLKSKNDWFGDNHFEMLKQYGFKNPHIVTFNRIPPNAIRLVYKQN